MSAESTDKSLATEILGITETEANPEELYEHICRALGYNPSAPSNPDEYPQQLAFEETHDMDMVEEILDGKLDQATTLIDWLAYRRMMERYGQRAEGSANALLIGALGAVAASSFVHFANIEYGASHTYVLDLVAGKAKTRHGNFVYGDGLHLPFRSGTMDFVHTNHLLTDLRDPSSSSRSHDELMNELFAEIARVLRPGGQLLMKEITPGFKRHWKTQLARAKAMRFGNAVTDAISHEGLTSIKVIPSIVPKDTDFLFDPKRQFAHHPTEVGESMFDLYAKKPAA